MTISQSEPAIRFPVRGADISTLAEVEACGGRFRDRNGPEDPVRILRRYGINLLRLRLWNDPYDEFGRSYGAGTCDRDTVMGLARRGRDLGIPWLLDFHYSDFWADPGKQRVPKSWRSLDADGLAEAVYQFTCAELEAFRREGLAPAMVSVGNELSNGLLWPWGKYPAFENITRFVNAGIRAVRETVPDASIMLHLDNGGSNSLYRDWFDRYFAAGGADFDCIGVSYYPFWHGTLENLRRNLNDLALYYRKDLIVAETSFGYTLEDYTRYEKLAPDMRKGMAANATLAAKTAWPMTPEGQSQFLQDLWQVIFQVPEKRCRGFIYWEPAWIPVPGSGWATAAALDYIKEACPGGNEWANQALFDYDGNVLPALRTIQELRE